ncbi:hypothetical protein ACFXTO_005117 [Malus domestica]
MMEFLIDQASGEYDIDFLKPFLSTIEYDAILETHIGDPMLWDMLLKVASFFQHQQIIPSQVLAAISTNVYAFTDASRIPTMSVVQSRHVNPVHARWTTPSPSFVKINVDANWVVAMDARFVGVVVRDSFGSFVDVDKYCLNAPSVAATERKDNKWQMKGFSSPDEELEIRRIIS